METLKISEAQEPQKIYEPKTKGPQTKEPQIKETNPIRVAAGKKCAEARWNKQKTSTASTSLTVANQNNKRASATGATSNSEIQCL